MGVKIFRRLKLQMNGVFDKLQVKRKSDEVQSDQICAGYSQMINDSKESNEDVFDENKEMLSFDNSKDEDHSFDFRTRASFRALLFRTYTLTRSNRRIRRDSSSSCCKPMNMGFIGQIYWRDETRKVKRSLSSGSHALTSRK